jgi:hypothetical protein
MSTDNPSRVGIERREALIKLGKYAAYATPVVLGSVGSALAAPPDPPPPPPPPPPSHHS